jgi:hypothetical protein
MNLIVHWTFHVPDFRREIVSLCGSVSGSTVCSTIPKAGENRRLVLRHMSDHDECNRFSPISTPCPFCAVHRYSNPIFGDHRKPCPTLSLERVPRRNCASSNQSQPQVALLDGQFTSVPRAGITISPLLSRRIIRDRIETSWFRAN